MKIDGYQVHTLYARAADYLKKNPIKGQTLTLSTVVTYAFYCSMLGEDRKPLKFMIESIGISSAGITCLGDRMITMGFIKREHSDTDRRAIFWVATKEGRKLTAKILG